MTDKNQLWPHALTVTRNVNRDLTYHNGHVPKWTLCFSEQKLIFHFVQLHTATNKIQAIKIMKTVWKFKAFW